MANARDVKYYQYHTYQPYNATYKNNDEIRIPVNSQDLYTVPGESKLYVEGVLTFTKKIKGDTSTDGAVCTLSNNAVAHLFDQIRYEINGVEVDKTRMVGVTSTAKVLLTMTKEETTGLKIAGWNSPPFHEPTKTFYAQVPLDMLLGFAGDFKGALIRVRQELILIRSRTNKNAYVITAGADKEEVSLTLTKVQWQMPHIKFNLNAEKIILDKVKNNATFEIAFRCMETHVYPQLPQTSRETWKLMTTTNVQAPCYIALMCLTNRMDNEKLDASKFDHVEMRSVTVSLNGEDSPYEKQNEEFDKNRFLTFYRNYLESLTDFSHGQKLCEPALTMDQFKDENPIFVIKCLYEDIIKPGPLDIQIELEAHKNFPANTSVYAILFHDVMYSYMSLSGIVKKIR